MENLRPIGGVKCHADTFLIPPIKRSAKYFAILVSGYQCQIRVSIDVIVMVLRRFGIGCLFRESTFRIRGESQRIMECRRAIGGMKRRKESGVTKEEIQRLQNIERKYKKILGLAADVANADD